MPEITRAEAVQERLNALDEKLEGAIKAAEVLSHIRTNSEEQLRSLQSSVNAAKVSEKELQDLAYSIDAMHQNFKAMHKERINADQEAQANRDKLEDEVRNARREIDDKWLEVEKRLQNNVASANSHTLELMKKLSKAANQSAGAADASANNVNDIVKDLKASLDAKFHGFQSQIESTVHNWTSDSVKRSDEFRSEILAKYTDVKEATQKSLNEHLSAVDKSMTAFLEKQNVLIQNLTQHADGFERIAKRNAESTAALNDTVHSLIEKIQQLENRLEQQNTVIIELQDKSVKKGWFR